MMGVIVYVVPELYIRALNSELLDFLFNFTYENYHIDIFKRRPIQRKSCIHLFVDVMFYKSVPECSWPYCMYSQNIPVSSRYAAFQNFFASYLYSDKTLWK
jgi:hypothetical protein